MYWEECFFEHLGDVIKDLLLHKGAYCAACFSARDLNCHINFQSCLVGLTEHLTFYFVYNTKDVEIRGAIEHFDTRSLVCLFWHLCIHSADIVRKQYILLTSLSQAVCMTVLIQIRAAWELYGLRQSLSCVVFITRLRKSIVLNLVENSHFTVAIS